MWILAEIHAKIKPTSKLITEVANEPSYGTYADPQQIALAGQQKP